MLRINPPTALLLLTDIVDLRPGDWVIQNVANSAVGRLLIRLARARGAADGERGAARRRCSPSSRRSAPTPAWSTGRTSPRR